MLTKRQIAEIDFLQKHFARGVVFSNDHKVDFVNATVFGVGEHKDKFSDNPILHAKRRLDITLALWREDIARGLLTKDELLEDFTDSYGISLVKSLVSSITPAYRKLTICNIDGTQKGVVTPLAFLTI